MSALGKVHPDQIFQNYLADMPTPLQVGEEIADRIPRTLRLTRLVDKSAVEFFPRNELSDGIAVVFSVPKAFTPVCSNTHLPGITAAVKAFSDLNAKVFCVAHNTRDEMFAWQNAQDNDNPGAPSAHEVRMIPDFQMGQMGHCLGMLVDKSGGSVIPRNLGLIWQRSSMIVIDGVVRDIQIEENPIECSISSAQETIKRLGEHLKFPQANDWIHEHQALLREHQRQMIDLYGDKEGPQQAASKACSYTLDQLPSLPERIEDLKKNHIENDQWIKAIEAEVANEEQLYSGQMYAVALSMRRFQGLLIQKQIIEDRKKRSNQKQL